jgi:hypothetical protein
MKHRDLTKSTLSEAGVGLRQEPTFDPNATVSDLSLNDTDFASAGPQPTQPSRAAQLKQQAGQLGQRGLRGLGGAIKATPGVLSKLSTGIHGAVQGYQQAQQSRLGRQDAEETAKIFINQWNKAIGQNPSLNTPSSLLAFAEKIAPDLASKTTPDGKTIQGELVEPTDMSAKGVANYIINVVATDKAGEAIFGGSRPTDAPALTAQQQAEKAEAEKQVRIKELVNQIEAGNAAHKELDRIRGLTTSISKSIAGTDASKMTTATNANNIPIDSVLENNFSGILWKQMREGK